MTSDSKKEDRPFFAYHAVMLCVCGLLFAGFAIRSYREEEVMRTMPATAATVVSLTSTKNGFAAELSFEWIAHGNPVACRDEIGLNRWDERARVGAVVHLIPRADSCGEAVVIGERNTALFAVISGVALLASLVSGAIAARSMLWKRPIA